MTSVTMRLGSSPWVPRAQVQVVDDEPEVAAVLRDVLVEQGYAVELAADGPQALRLHRPGRRLARARAAEVGFVATVGAGRRLVPLDHS